MAVAGFACSVAVLLITALMILVPYLADVPEAVVGLLLLAGATLWVSGLVLSSWPGAAPTDSTGWPTPA